MKSNTPMVEKAKIQMEWKSMICRRAIAALFGGFLLFTGIPKAGAEGGAGPEAMMMGNMCMVMFGYDMIHITAYLPGKSRSEYCEEIPATGKVILVFDIANPKFRDLPLELRIIRDPLTPVTTDTKLEPLTEVHLPATMYKKGTFSVEHDFKDNGNYIGLVTLTKENGEKETQQFKFTVGDVLWLYISYALGSILIGLFSIAYWRHSHASSKTAPAAKS